MMYPYHKRPITSGSLQNNKRIRIHLKNTFDENNNDYTENMDNSPVKSAINFDQNQEIYIDSK